MAAREASRYPRARTRRKRLRKRSAFRPTARFVASFPIERESITHKFAVGGHEGYITVGKYEDGTPGEIFVVMAKEGSTISGLMDSFATMTSLALQHGVPLQLLVDKFTHTRFEPSGFTKNPEIPMAKSIMDYIFKWLAIKFLNRESQENAGVILRDIPPAAEKAAETKAVGNVTELSKTETEFVNRIQTSPTASAKVSTPSAASDKTVGFAPAKKTTFLYQQDAPSCSDCGSIMVRNGACYKCLELRLDQRVLLRKDHHGMADGPWPSAQGGEAVDGCLLEMSFV